MRLSKDVDQDKARLLQEASCLPFEPSTEVCTSPDASKEGIQDEYEEGCGQVEINYHKGLVQRSRLPSQKMESEFPPLKLLWVAIG